MRATYTHNTPRRYNPEELNPNVHHVKTSNFLSISPLLQF
jgi:hypothetical protein